MATQISEISKVFLYGETLESSELNAIILQINTTIRKLNTVESNLDNHSYDVSIPITNIYCRTKKGINAINFFPQADAKRDELLEEVSNCSITQGIKYNTTFSTVTLSENADLMNGVWTSYPQGVNESLPHEWEVSYKKLSDNSIMYMFGPVLRSNYGYSGVDGDGVQYVYRLFNHELSDIERTNNTPIRPENPNSNGEFIPYGWSDEPLGPTSDYPYEYVATLKRINGTWGSFEKIALWSTYTEDGANGDFLIRAFCRFTPTSNKLTPNKPIGGTYENPLPGSNDNILWSLKIPEGSEPLWTSIRIFKGTGESTEWSVPVIEADSSELDIEYSSSLEKPDVNTLRNVPKTPHPSNNVWHDASESNLDLSTMVWRAERKIKNGQYDGNWVITKITGSKGAFKSIVFRRFKPTIQQSSPATPTGGTYSNPIPDGGLWYDGVPEGDSKIDGPVWSSTKTFYDDGTLTNWSPPQLQSDSVDLDIEFSPGIGEEHTQPSNPTGEPFSNREESGWYDPSSANFNSVGPMIWRAERKVNNGQYVGAWTVTKIVGEIGPEGRRGSFKSCVFKRSNSVINNFNVTVNEIGDGATYDSPIPKGSGVFAGWTDGIPAGTETLWMAVSLFTGEGNNHSNWTVTQQTDNVDLDIEFSPGEGSAYICPTMSNSVFNTPIANYETNGNPPAITNERDLRNRLGWWDASLINNQSPTMIWRAERKVKNGQYEGNWVITRIKGEKGDGQPDYTQTQEAWSNDETTTNVYTAPATDYTAAAGQPGSAGYPKDADWHDTTPTNTNYYAYLWRRSRKMVLQDDGTYVAATGSDGQWKYARLSGTNGTSISVKGTVATVADLSNITNPQNGDAYVVSANGHLYMWSSEASGWIDLGEFKGDPGTTYYTHIAWATSVNTTIPWNGTIPDGQISTPNYGQNAVTGGDVAPSDSKPWMGILINTSSGPDTTNWHYYTWQKVEGPQGEDAVSIVISPASLIVNQDLQSPNNLSNLTQTFVVRVYKGDVEQTVGGLSFMAESMPNSSPVKYKCLFLNGGGQRSGNSNIAGNVLTLKQINTYTQDGKTLYYDSMYADVTATYNTNKTITARVRIYANLLGTWKETVEADVKHEVATGKFYFKDSDGNVVAYETIGDYIKSSTLNISRLAKTIDDGKNLLTVTKGWEGPNGAAVQYDNKYFGVKSSGALYSPVRPGLEGEQYCFSAYIAVGSQTAGNPGFCYGTSYTHASDLDDNGTYQSATFIEIPGDTIMIDSTPYQRYYFRISGNIVKERYFTIYNDGSYWLYCPQLELGTEPTAFASSSVEISSQIKQEADAITLAVQRGYATKSELLITADGITAEVNAIKASKNLFSGALTGAGWYSEPSVPYDNHPQSQVSVDSNGYMNMISGGNYICKAVTIERNLDYVLSLFGKVTSSFQVGVWIPASSAVNWQQVTTLSFSAVSSSSTRRVKSFKLSGSGSVTILFTIPLAAIRYPQLELGEEATAFVGGDTEVSSRIKQTADEIDLSITNKLGQTGININGNNRTIRLDADNVEISDKLAVPKVISQNDDMITTIEAGQLVIRSKRSSSYGIFAINSLDEIVLQMYDKDGAIVLNLGGTPNTQVNGEWEELEMRMLTTAEISSPSKANMTANAVGSATKPCIKYYRLKLGKLMNSNNTLEYYLPNGTQTTNQNVINLDGCVFTSTANSESDILSLTFISLGFYVFRNDGIFKMIPVSPTESSKWYENGYTYNNGKNTAINKYVFTS